MSTGRPGSTRRQGILAVAYRDLLEFVRDRRTLFVTLLMPMAMYPILALASSLGLRAALSDLEAREAPRRLGIAVSGAEGEGFAARLRDLAATGDRGPQSDLPAQLIVHSVTAAEARRMIDDGRADAWIAVPAGTLGGLDGLGTVRLEGRLSALRPADARLQRHLLAVVEGLAEDARRRRLAAEGLPETALEPLAFSLAGQPLSSGPDSLGGVVGTAVGGVLVLLALLTATGGFYPAIDAIAGEKERGTIETLLIAPCRTGDIVCGKYLAVFTVTLATLAINAVSIVLTSVVLVRLLPAWLDLGISPRSAAACAGVTLAAFTGLASVAAAMCLAVTSASRSTKEAQNTLTPVLLLVSGLSGAALLPSVDGWTIAGVPFAGQVSVARSVLSLDATAPTAADVAGRLAVSLGSAAFITWLLLRAAAVALTDEELLFRGPDSAGGVLARPAPRPTPTPLQGFAAVLVALSWLWYVQGLAPATLTLALPLQQAGLLLALAAIAAWQRVDRRLTFGLRLPDRPLAATLGALAVGAGLFVVGAAATLAIRGPHLSAAARGMATRLMDLATTRPAAAWLLIAVLPAICEEVFFRGWLLAACAGERPRRGRATAAILLQAAAFAAFHLLPERMPQTFALGILLGWMTLATRSLLPAVVAHAAHNAVPLVLVTLADGGAGPRLAAGDTSLLPAGIVAAASVALLAGAALVAAGRRHRPAAPAGPPD